MLRRAMSEDEIFALVVSGVGLIVFAFLFLMRTLGVDNAGRNPAGRTLVVLSWVAATVMLVAILNRLAAHDVRDSVTYTVFYFIMGLAWVGGAFSLLPWLDWNYREDVLERNNPAVAIGLAGWIVGLMLAFGGANIGDGPGWWVVIFCALLSTGALMLSWLIVDRATGWVEHITIDRDVASGIRAAAFLIAGGMIAGRAVAGNWESSGDTIDDFLHQAWGLLPLALVAGILQITMPPNESRPQGSVAAALFGGALLLGFAVAFVKLLGPIR